MKKSLIALAVAGSFAAPAFAATSNVDIYGIFGASVDIIDRDISTQDNEFRLSSTASRIGFKGSEDLGGGLSAIWQVETALNIDTNAGGAWGSRNTFVGLSSKSLGTVRLGHYDTAYKMSTGRLDVFVDTLADYNTIMGSASGSNAAFDVREQNSISYETPDISGLKLMGTYGQRNEGGSKTLNPELWSLAATYANGPLFGALAYEIHKDVGVNRDVDAVKAALGYKFGSTTLGAAYEKIDDDAANSVLSRNAWYLSARHDMGNIALKGAYGSARDADAPGDQSADFWALGVDYALSKRTVAYAIYVNLDNDAAADFTLGGNGTNGAFAPGAGNDPAGLSLGIKHSF